MGHEDKLQAIVAAFQDYWDLTYADVPVPKAGWPSPVITSMCDQGPGHTDLTTSGRTLVHT